MKTCESYLGLPLLIILLLLNSFHCSYTEETGQSNVTNPSYCSCEFDQEYSLTVSCFGVPQKDFAIVIRDINKLIEFYSHNASDIRNIAINNSPIEEIPRALCEGYKNLEILNLNGNRLKLISAECFRDKKALRQLSIAHNYITNIETSLIHNLESLVALDLSYNLLEYIPSIAFRNISRSSLSIIHLQNNKLKTIGVWPFSQSVKFKNLMVDVSNNEIEEIINDEDFYTNCSTLQNAELILYLGGNKLYHLSDIFGKFLRSMTEFHCVVLVSKWKLSSITPSNLYCDCLDYKFYRYMRYWMTDVTVLSKIQCIDKYRKAITVDLNELTCSVSESCPRGCRCINQPSNSTYHVLCSFSGATNLPERIPPRDKPKSFFMPSEQPEYKLDYSNCNLTTIEERSYFKNTTWIDLSNSNIHNITYDAWKSMKNVKIIFLNNNQISTLPKAIQETNMTFEELHLYNNPFRCNCEDKWLKDWLTANSNRLRKGSNIFCYSPPELEGQSILALQDEQFCAVSKQLSTTLIVTIVAIVILAAVITALLFRSRIQLFNKIHIHPFDRDECEGEEMDYDVMISFSHFDRAVAFQILTLLEQKFYKVCYPPRDFVPGMSIMDNITTSINRSKRTLCIISASYISRSYCLEEFNIALNRDTVLRKHRLIMLILDDALVEMENTLERLAMTMQPTDEHQVENTENDGERERLINDDDDLLLLENNDRFADLNIFVNAATINQTEHRGDRLHNDDEIVNPVEDDDSPLHVDEDNANRLGEYNLETLMDISAEVQPVLVNLKRLNKYLKSHKCIEYQSPTWESQLLYLLPINRLTQAP